VASLGAMAILFGVALGYAGIKFKTVDDPKLEELKKHLPGTNCGGCGFAGCETWIKGVYDGTAKPEACAVISDDGLKNIGRIMDIEVEPAARGRAFVMCAGDDGRCARRYEYRGVGGCVGEARHAGGGSKSCGYGCLGGGSCAEACVFGAVTVENGIARIDPAKCTACGTCARKCPKGVITIIPYAATVASACSSRDAGKKTREHCAVGCIGCGRCVRTCAYGAVRVDNALAVIDRDKCTGCGECVKTCPTKAMTDIKLPAYLYQISCDA